MRFRIRNGSSTLHAHWTCSGALDAVIRPTGPCTQLSCTSYPEPSPRLVCSPRAGHGSHRRPTPCVPRHAAGPSSTRQSPRCPPSSPRSAPCPSSSYRREQLQVSSFYLVGSGIAPFAAAAYLIRDIRSMRTTSSSSRKKMKWTALWMPTDLLKTATP